MSAQYNRLAEDEANALVKILETDTRKVLVIVISAEGDEGTLLRAASNGTKASDARIFVQAVDRERDRLASKLIRRK